MIIHSLQDSPKRVQWLPNALTISIKSLNMAHKNSDFWNLIILVFFLYSSITGVLWVLFVCVVQTLPLRTINACPWWNSIYVSIQLVIVSRLQFVRLSANFKLVTSFWQGQNFLLCALRPSYVWFHRFPQKYDYI